MVQLSPRKGPPGCEVSCHGTEWTCIVGSSVILQSGPTRSLVANFLQRSVVACSTQISCCRGRMLQTRPRTGMCEPLMLDVMAPEMHQNNRSYVRSADLPSDTLREILAWWAVTRRTLKNNKTVNIAGVGACTGMDAC